MSAAAFSGSVHRVRAESHGAADGGSHAAGPGLIYSDILERTGASSATISRVNRALLNGTGGYVSVLDKMKEDDHEQL